MNTTNIGRKRNEEKEKEEKRKLFLQNSTVVFVGYGVNETVNYTAIRRLKPDCLSRC